MFPTIQDIQWYYSSIFDPGDMVLMTETRVRHMEAEYPYNVVHGPRAKVPLDHITKYVTIHTAHDMIRYKRINDVTRRLTDGPYAMHHWSAGDPLLVGDQTKIPFVVWLSEFSKPLDACLDPSKLYIYLTPRGFWYGYSPGLKDEPPFHA